MNRNNGITKGGRCPVLKGGDPSLREVLMCLSGQCEATTRAATVQPSLHEAS